MNMEELAAFIQTKLHLEQQTVAELQKQQQETRDAEFRSLLINASKEITAQMSGAEVEEQQTEETILQFISKAQNETERVSFNIGGQRFVTTRQTVQRQESILEKVFSSSLPIDKDEQGAIMFDRNPKHFNIMLQYLRSNGKMPEGIGLPSDVDELYEVLDDAQFYSLSGLVSLIESELKRKLKRTIPSDKTNTERKERPIDRQSTSQNVHELDNSSEVYWENLKQLTQSHYQPQLEVLMATEKERRESDKQLRERQLADINELQQKAAVVLNIGGTTFSLSIPLVAKYPDSLFPQLMKIKLPNQSAIFLDRDPTLFRYIYDYMNIDATSTTNATAIAAVLPKDDNKKLALVREAKFFRMQSIIDHLNPLRFPIETIGEENLKMKREEDFVRELFATQRSHPLLDDPHLLLLPVFRMRNTFDRCDRRLSHLPLLFDFEDRMQAELFGDHIPAHKPIQLVDDITQFKKQFDEFTSNQLRGLNWSNVFAAGGSVLACMFPDSVETHWPTNYIDALETILSNTDDIHQGDSNRSEPDPKRDAWSQYSWEKPFESHYHSHESRARRYRLNTTEQWFGNGYADADIDLFLYGLNSEAAAEAKVREIYETLKQNTKHVFVLRTRNAITFKCNDSEEATSVAFTRGRKRVDRWRRASEKKSESGRRPNRTIQVILRLYKSPAEILMGFDIDACKVGFDGTEVWALPHARRAISERINLVDIDRQSTTYELRLFKYACRGFRVCIPGFDRSLVRKPDILQYVPPSYYIENRISPTTYQNSSGLARLLLFERVLKKYTKMGRRFLTGIRQVGLRDLTFSVEGKHITQQSDYCNIPLNLKANAVACYNRFEKLHTSMRKFRSQWQPDYTYGLDNIDSILYANTETTSLSSEVQWITVNPGRQSIGSFHPTNHNFFYDAYSACEPHGTAKWFYSTRYGPPMPESNTKLLTPYPPEVSQQLEAAFRRNATKTVVTFEAMTTDYIARERTKTSTTHSVNFTSMKFSVPVREGYKRTRSRSGIVFRTILRNT